MKKIFLAIFLLAVIIFAIVVLIGMQYGPWKQGPIFSSEEEGQILLSVQAFEQSDGQDIGSFIGLAKVLSAEKIVEFCKRNLFTEDQAVCLRTMALGKESPAEIAAVCEKINSDFCSSLSSTEEKIQCQEAVPQHKKECPLQLPIWR